MKWRTIGENFDKVFHWTQLPLLINTITIDIDMTNNDTKGVDMGSVGFLTTPGILKLNFKHSGH